MNSGLVHPCNPVSFHVTHYSAKLAPGTLITGITEVHNHFTINLQIIYVVQRAASVTYQCSAGRHIINSIEFLKNSGIRQPAYH